MVWPTLEAFLTLPNVLSLPEVLKWLLDTILSHRSQKNDDEYREPLTRSVPAEEVMIKELYTRSITPEWLMTEAKGIYVGLTIVESKCIEMDSGLNTTLNLNNI
ncbi:uncharacterized protein BCR38DRAFT_480353 [Pseudomassariella vexata]|uniref:Uncharacterized protein n=1 Tax=Pseudomassariella vexata TaxID=1141098 RepID=A0A1Y2EKQ2_9PEZI|nr:uncharacterized protein BCR38DRAFT_480353 [Pseudomassariella vexata]ORY71876.1 hypothetical protein BCR38DRAFT_480353 [Pseudomassariella vexata]